MKIAFSILLALTFRPWSLGGGERDYFAVWNIGQGSWATLVSEHRCLHFDMGGERARWPVGVNACLQVPNLLHISHLDWDHISNIGAFSYRAIEFCLARVPRDMSLRKVSPGKVKLFKKLRPCASQASPARELEFSITSKDPNTLSRIYLYRDFLLPGDSSRTAEKIWAPLLSSATDAMLSPHERVPSILVLGHHGSRTSTSDLLLYKMAGLKLAVASARRAKYGHPHLEIVQKLAQKKIPLLLTQKWGSLLFQI